MVRPCTSLEDIDVSDRPRENTARAARMMMPAPRPLPTAAVRAIAATPADWMSAPVTKTHLRCRTRSTTGVSITWGNIEPDSRIGTSNPGDADRSEEHTSELQSRGHLVCRTLLEKKNAPSVITSTTT